jgi:hypothetical protein
MFLFLKMGTTELLHVLGPSGVQTLAINLFFRALPGRSGHAAGARRGPQRARTKMVAASPGVRAFGAGGRRGVRSAHPRRRRRARRTLNRMIMRRGASLSKNNYVTK